MAPGDARLEELDGDARPLDAARDGDALADGGCPLPPDAGTRPECSNGIDDDGDGRVDALDPDCTSPYGTSESHLAIGVMGNFDICGRDCAFDNDPGQGNDGCDWRVQCDPLHPLARCGSANTGCPSSQSQRCRDTCLPLTPNGCDCFGCCLIDVGGERRTVLFGEGIPCSSASLSDPASCPSCTQNQSCLNPCLPGEVCFAGATPTPTDGGGQVARCPAGQMACGESAAPACACPASTYCVTGCCVPYPFP